MAKEAAMIEAMERKLRGGGGGVGVATTKEEQRNETPESNSSEVEGEAWLPRGDHENETEVEVDDEEDDEVGGGGDGSLGFLKDFDYSAEATRIAAMEAQLRQLRNGGREAIESGDEEVEEEEEEEGGEGSEGSGSDNENLNNEVVEEEDGGRNNDVGDNNEDLPFDLSTYLTGQSQPRKGGAQQQGWNGSNDDEDIRDAAQARSLHSLQGGSPSADMLHASSNTPPTGEADRGNNGRNARASSGRQYSRTNGAAADSSYNRGTPSPRFTSKKSDDENEEEEEEDDDGVEEDEQREEERAALAIQTAARGRVGRQRVAIRRRRHDEKNAQNAAAIRIQTAERSRRSSVQVQRKRQQQQQQSQKEHATKHNWHNDEYGIDRGDRRAPSPLRAAAAAAVVVPLLDLSASDVTAWLNASGLNAVATALVHARLFFFLLEFSNDFMKVQFLYTFSLPHFPLIISLFCRLRMASTVRRYLTPISLKAIFKRCVHEVYFNNCSGCA